MSGKNVGGGSIFLKILIVLLIGVLYISVDLPSRQWKKQAADLKEARLRMENLNTAALQYLYFNRRFPKTYDDMKASLDTCILHMPPVTFSYDDKQLDPDNPRDSLLVSAEDTMRIQSFALSENLSRTLEDGRTLKHTMIWATMKPQYSALGTDTLHLYCEQPIIVKRRGAGARDFSLWASAPARFDRAVGGMTRGDSSFIKATDFSFSMNFDDIFTCPTTGKPFEFKHVAKYTYKGELLFELDGQEGQPVNARNQQEGFLSAVKTLVSNEVALRFQSLTDSAKAEGNETYQVPEDAKNQIVVSEILNRLNTLKPRQKFSLTSEKTQVARADSSDYFDNPAMAERTLFPETSDGSQGAQFKTLLASPAVQELLPRLVLDTRLEPVRIDTVGVAIYSPIVGNESYLSGWKKIFEVDPPENHGSIYNGTSSWE
ncbi:MAG: hypothetical protein KDC10_07910 [Calditrichaeota bacterium]|nr:hypothetical protein [Calditrichota bacterium]MCB9474867.1 hypothetical protein [Candidatus Delongbacteria bacterium]